MVSFNCVGMVEEEQPQVVALAFPLQGHINPMLRLCKRLSALGVSIKLVHTSSIHKRLMYSRQCAGLGSLREQGFQIDMLSLDVPEDYGSSEDINYASYVLSERMQAPFQCLLEQLLSEPNSQGISCIISDAFLGWTEDVAKRFSIPRMALWALSAAYNLINLYLPMLNERGFAPIRDKRVLKDETQLIDFVPGVTPLHPRELPAILRVDTPADPGFNKRWEGAARLKQAAWLLCNTIEELEPSGVDAMQLEAPNYVALGNILPSAFFGGDPCDMGNGEGLWPEDQRCLPWLNSQSPSSVVYIAFGSFSPLSAAQAKEIASGLEDSRQPFLWVIRPGQVTDPSFKLFCKEFVQRTQDRGLVVDWSPQLQVLFHPSIGGFISHCGWNSTLESVAMGVPLIGMPLVAEQDFNCKLACIDWKVGIKLQKDDTTGLVPREEVENVITKFMRGEDGTMELRIRARELREVVQRASQNGSSDKRLKAFVKALENKDKPEMKEL